MFLGVRAGEIYLQFGAQGVEARSRLSKSHFSIIFIAVGMATEIYLSVARAHVHSL